MTNRADTTLAEAAQGLRAKAFSAVDLLDACLARTDAHEKTLNSFITETREMAHDQARDVDQRLAKGEDLPPLAGLPVAIKDIIVVGDVPTTAGSSILRNYIPSYHATVVERLLGQYAVIVGKTNCDEFALGASGEQSAYGITRNPWDTERVPGGSSSGSAVAVAAGQALYALGTDTGGSVRQPSAFTNLVGFKPTYGRISRYGLIAAASSLDTIGIFTRSVADAQTVTQAICGRDPRDATSSAKKPPHADLSAADLKGKTIGVPKQYFVDGMDPQVERIVHEALAGLKKRGAKILDVDLPETAYALPSYYIIQPAETSSNLARFDGVRYGIAAGEPGQSLIDQYKATRHAGLGDEPKRRIMIGTHVLSTGYVDQYYGKAQKVRTVITAAYQKILSSVDCLVGATTPTPAFRIGEKIEDPVTMYLSDILTVAANITGLPALSVPGGFVDGLPVGVQVIAGHFDEETLFTVGHVLEEVTGASRKRPPLVQNPVS